MQGQTTPAQSAGSATSVAALRKPRLPTVERYSTHYVRYNCPISLKGANQSTHTAEVKFPTGPKLAVVKAFSLREKGWVNEALAWALGEALDVGVPPESILLAVSAADLASATEPELVHARDQLGSLGPIMLWCATRLDLKPPQYAWRLNWERAATSKPRGRKLAAFDAWLGNCDRIAQNAPYWMSRGHIAAIDHERLAFNQDWRLGVPIHMDVKGGVVTHLMSAVRDAINKKVLKANEATQLVSELAVISATHAETLASCHAEAEALVADNFSTNEAQNLLTFLADRATQDYINSRLEQL